MHGHMAGREKSPAFSEPWQELCIAIVRKAADDYIDVLRKLWKLGVSIQAKRKLLKDKIELESFFQKSNWRAFSILNGTSFSAISRRKNSCVAVSARRKNWRRKLSSGKTSRKSENC